MMKTIELTQGKQALVSASDYAYLSGFKWCYNARLDCAARGIWDKDSKQTTVVSMHRFLMGTPRGMDTDHINGDRLDNRRENLRVCSHADNQANMKMHKDNSSGYKGVSLAKSGNWVAKIRNRTIGTFANKVDAAKAYNQKAVELYGHYAKLNDLGEVK